MGYLPYQLVQDFFHQQYDSTPSTGLLRPGDHPAEVQGTFRRERGPKRRQRGHLLGEQNAKLPELRLAENFLNLKDLGTCEVLAVFFSIWFHTFETTLKFRFSQMIVWEIEFWRWYWGHRFGVWKIRQLGQGGVIRYAWKVMKDHEIDRSNYLTAEKTTLMIFLEGMINHFFYLHLSRHFVWHYQTLFA